MRKESRRTPILLRVLAYYILLDVLLVLLTGTLSILFYNRYALSTRSKELRHRAVYLASVFDASQSDENTLTGEALQQLEEMTSCRVTYLTEDYQLYYRSFLTGKISAQDLYGLLDGEDISPFKSMLEGNTVTRRVSYRFLEEHDALISGVPLMDPQGNVRAALILYRPVRQIHSVVLNAVSISLLSALMAGIITAIAAFYLSRRITQPLRKLNQTASRMAEGHYDERFFPIQRDEIGELGSTLNLLSARLGTVISDLQNEKGKLEEIIAGIGEGILAFDCSGALVHYNQAALEVLELTAWPDAPQEDTEHHIRDLLEMISCALTTGQRRESVWTTGTGRAIRARVWPVVNGENQLTAAVVLVRDVSEYQRLEQLRRDYVANISHELRTPLTGIRGMVEPLMDGLMETEQEKQDCYKVIYDETLRLQKMITEMLNISRLQDGRVTIETEPMQVEGLLQAALRRMQDRADQGGVALSVRTESPLPLVLGSEDHVLQVLIILLDNALCFTPAGGKVTLYAHPVLGDHMCVGVKDSGSGIDPKDLPYIWERFYKADRARVQSSGTGLGLAIAKLTVEHMNGAITVDSQPGQGSTFEFFLPLAPDEQN